jgi:hypothetical protein
VRLDSTTRSLDVEEAMQYIASRRQRRLPCSRASTVVAAGVCSDPGDRGPARGAGVRGKRMWGVPSASS